MDNRITQYSWKLAPLCAMAVAVALSACSDPSQSPTLPDLRPSIRQDVKPGASTFTSFDVGTTSTTPLDINAKGDVVGRFVSGGQTHGFLRSADGEITTIDYPGAMFTVAAGINSKGEIVGWYAQTAVPGPLTPRHGFLLSKKGEFTSFDPTGSQFTNALGINERGDVTGRFCTALPCAANSQGFLWRNGETTVIDVPGSVETDAWKINPDGEILGAFRVSGGPNRLFTLRGSDLTTFDLPGALPVSLANGGINARGDMVSFYCDASPCAGIGAGTHGFLLQDGALTTIDFPGAQGTGAFGINPRGDVVGAYTDASGKLHGFLLTR